MVTMEAASQAAVREPVRAPTRWTHEEVDALPDDGMRHELLDGILLMSPAPIPRHQRAVTRIWQLLERACPAGYEVFVAPLDWRPDGDTSLEPDVLLVPQSALTETNVTGTPAIVVEVLSPGTARIDKTAKMSRYFDGGIGQYWLVDPGAADTGVTEPGGDDRAGRPAAVEVYDRTEGEYLLQARATGDETITVRGPATVTVTASELVRPR